MKDSYGICSIAGGWKSVAVGMRMLIVTAEHGKQFQQLIYEQGVAPGVITLEV